jgi:fumarate reductase subunit D
MKKSVFLTVMSFVLPLGAAAQVSNLSDVFTFINNLLNTLLPLIIAAAVVYFVYGIARYVMAGDEAAKEAAKDKIIYGVIGLFVMVSVWGLVNILTNTFFGGSVTNGAPSNVNDQIPDVQVTL